MPKITGVLFDLDGTILDTADDLGAALNFVLTEYNLPTVTSEAYRPIASDGAKGLLELGFGDKITDYDFATLRQMFLNYYEENIAHHTKLYDGITELIDELNAKNIAWGIVTNKPEGLTLRLLPHFPELAQSQVMVGGDSLTERKPHPAPLLYSLNKINVPAQQCFYVGDAPRDIEAGNRANMPTIIAGWGYISNINDCDTWQSDHLCLSPTDILALI
jgi:phosphoglycolate phosphatase